MKKAICLVAMAVMLCTSLALADNAVGSRAPLGPVNLSNVDLGAGRTGTCSVGLLDLNDPGVSANRFGAEVGEVYKIYLDPETDQLGPDVCSAPIYPYHISSVDVIFVINGADSTLNIGKTFTFTVDIECPADGPSTNVTRSCKGPGATLCSVTASHTITSEEWNGDGTIVINVPIDCCIDAPVFAGVELTAWDGEIGGYPGVLFQFDPPYPNQFCRVWAYWNLGNGFCFFNANTDVGCGAGCAIGPWGIYLNGEAGVECIAQTCTPCPNNLVGDAADDPIHVNQDGNPGATNWSQIINLCNYCSDYDFSFDNELFGYWNASFTGAGPDVVIQIDPDPSLPCANLDITITPLCDPSMTQFRIRWWLKDAFGTFASAGFAPFGFPAIGAPVVISSSQVGCYDAGSGPYQLFIDTRNCCCPIRVNVVGDHVLAAEFRTFDAVAGDGEVTLNWATASETNVDRFEIMRDGQIVDFVRSQGNSQTGHSYTFVDRNLENGVLHNYYLAAYDVDGQVSYSPTVSATPHMGIVANEYGLAQNFPNPFNPSTQISYSLKEDGLVSLKVFAIDGREVATLVSGSVEAGVYTVDFDGAHLASGVYLYTLEVNGYSATHKMVLMK